ncbi:hypothetical protein H4582DRAFT_2092376 [Lactarius indigo]|nr:hypothetical protein H4582DRAFT_2092376 [Lactarius indigo]
MRTHEWLRSTLSPDRALQPTTRPRQRLHGTSVQAQPVDDYEYPYDVDWEAADRIRLNRDSVNPLAGILIPKPLFQVPAKELDAVSSSAAMPTSKGSKSKKLMIADPNLLTARNLFACDYLKDHSVTKSSFKAVWDSVDSGTRKKYEALSKERKLAACVASAATPSV